MHDVGCNHPRFAQADHVCQDTTRQKRILAKLSQGIDGHRLPEAQRGVDAHGWQLGDVGVLDTEGLTGLVVVLALEVEIVEPALMFFGNGDGFGGGLGERQAAVGRLRVGVGDGLGGIVGEGQGVDLLTRRLVDRVGLGRRHEELEGGQCFLVGLVWEFILGWQFICRGVGGVRLLGE